MMNAALSFINLPFYTKQPQNQNVASQGQTALNVFNSKDSQSKQTHQIEVPQQISSQFLVQGQQANNNLYQQQHSLQNVSNVTNLTSFHQPTALSEYSGKKQMALNLEPTTNQLISNANNVNSVLLVNNNSNGNTDSTNIQASKNQTGNLMSAYTNSNNQHPIIESLVQSTPAATSTPNPIQQQNQSILNQDIITNLFLKFDPVQLLQQKDQLTLIASTLAASNNTSTNQNPGAQMQGQANNNSNSNSVIQANNLNSFNSLLSSNKSINGVNNNVGSNKGHADVLVKKEPVNNNGMAGQANNQQQFKLANTTAQINQTQKWGQNQQMLIQQQQKQQNQNNQHNQFINNQQQQQYQLINNLQQQQQQQQYHQQQIHQQMQQKQQQLQIQLQLQQQKQANTVGTAGQSSSNSSNLLNDSTSSSNDGGDQNSSNGNATGNERPYKCAQCFKTFRKKVHLNQHGRIHSGERPYGCDYCEKRFTQLSHLWQHRRRHTGERPYKCDVGTCDKSFTQLSNLQSHIKTHGNQSLSTAQSSDASMTSAIAAVAALSSSNPSSFSQLGSIPTDTGTNAKTKRGRAFNEINQPNKRHFCELCNKRFATEGVITKHRYSHQQNEALLVRNADGSLVIKAINNHSNATNK